MCSETPGSFKTLRHGVCHSFVDCDSEFVLTRTVAEGEQCCVPGRDKERLRVTRSDSGKLGVRAVLQRPTANPSVLPTGHTPRAFGWPPAAVGPPRRRRRFESSAPVSLQSVSKAEGEPRSAPLHNCDAPPSGPSQVRRDHWHDAVQSPVSKAANCGELRLQCSPTIAIMSPAVPPSIYLYISLDILLS